MMRTPWLLVLLPATVLAACGDDTATGGSGGGGGGAGGAGGGGGAGVDACANVDSLRATCQELPERFDASTTLAKGCYKASKSPIIGAGVTLTLAPGVTILFAEDTGLDVSETRALQAVGTAEEPICLTGDVAQRGSWKGLSLQRTDADDDRLEYVTVEYGGNTKIDAEGAAIKVISDSRTVTLSLANSTVRESDGYGLYLVASAELSAFEDNTFSANTLGPASVDSDVAGVLDAGSSYTGNDVDEVTVRSNRVSKNPNWAAIGVPFHLTAPLDVEVPWTIDAPNTLILPEDGWISVNGDDAALIAVGTEADPIVLTGAQKTRGYWQSLYFDTTNNPSNRLEHVTVEYGGSTKSDFDGAGVKARADSHGVTLSLTSTTIHECEGFGLYLTGSTTLPDFGDNTFTGNTLGPASVGSQAVHQLETSSTYTGNDVDRLRVRDDRVGKAVTWQDLGVPYQLEQNIHVDLVWTLAPGVTLLLAQDTWISVDGDEAGLHAVGTAAKPVTFSGVQKMSGFWHGLLFGNSLNGANAIEHAIVEYGGSPQGGGELGMITAQSDSHGVALTVKDSVIQNSAQYGIWLGGAAQYNADIESSNTFSSNVLGDVFFD